MGLSRLLEIPGLYDRFQWLVGGVRCRQVYVREHIRPQRGQRVLDIGCGTGDMLLLFPEVEYHGWDPSAAYINKAKQRNIANSHFHCGELTQANLEQHAYFDIVHSSGVLHHVDDPTAGKLIRTAFAALKPAGKFFTLDGCYHPGQSTLARIVLSADRGKYVRNEESYRRLAAEVFPTINSFLYPKLLRPLPYPVLIMEMTKPEDVSR